MPQPAPFAIPQTPKELEALVVQLGLMKAYDDITTAAREKRLTEHDIGLIERDVLTALRQMNYTAVEFKAFEAEPAIAAGQARLREHFQVLKNGRAQKVADKR